MKKDIDVNDCESPHPHPPPNSEKKEIKLRHLELFKNGKYKLPVFTACSDPFFITKGQNKLKKQIRKIQKKGFC